MLTAVLMHPLFDAVLAKGLPKAADLAALDHLGDSIAKKHAELQPSPFRSKDT